MASADPLAPWRPLVAALRAFHDGRHDATLVVHDDFGRRDTIPAAVFIRAPDAFFPVEGVA
ncbi:MAG: hypothetical protein H0U85_01105, partial [Gemmatimonadales bacterium]|nr:hypothetical protein [Gemmatimonadales bacterium]